MEKADVILIIDLFNKSFESQYINNNLHLRERDIVKYFSHNLAL